MPPPMRRKGSFDKLRMTTGEINTCFKRSLRYGRDDGLVFLYIAMAALLSGIANDGRIAR
jgi:hypothetical protein